MRQLTHLVRPQHISFACCNCMPHRKLYAMAAALQLEIVQHRMW